MLRLFYRPHEQILVESFRVLGQASRRILSALAWGLRVDSSLLETLLDNAPLHPTASSASMLSYFHYKQAYAKTEEGGGAASVCPAHVDKGLITILASTKPGLEVKECKFCSSVALVLTCLCLLTEYMPIKSLLLR
jgi:isopenicillin N synthase-like dioxygenase